MIIKTIVVTPFQQNCRLLIDENTGSICVVDPGGDVDNILAALSEEQGSVESIFLTHSHIDHVGGLDLLEAELREKGVSPKLYGHRAEETMRKTIKNQAAMFGLPNDTYRNAREPDVYLDQGDTFQLGEHRGEVRFAPGHSPGHVVLFFPLEEGPVLVAGDTLFAGSIGRTDLPGGNSEQLFASIREQIYTLPDETRVLPGHGPETSVGQEKISNPFVRV